MKNIVEAMNWRYATAKFDPSKKLSPGELGDLLESLRLAPSSFGLQPWKFILVTNPEIRARLKKAGYDQPKISEASHFLVFAVEKNIDDKLIEDYVESISKVRGIPLENLKGFAEMMKGTVLSKAPEERIEWATRQAYIALGVLVALAAVEGIDTAPIEGFDPKQFDEILGLGQMGLESKVAAAIGFRAPDDPAARMPKVRYPREKVIIEV